MSDAYARAGVDQRAADEAVRAIVAALSRIDPGRPSRQALASGHYANVIRLDEGTGVALSTDGVGTKLRVAEEMGRFDTIGIDCVAMNVNDLICVGAEPLAMLDYIAVDRADPELLGQVADGLRRGAEQAGIEIPGGELAQLGNMVTGLDVVGAAFGVVALDAIVTGARIEPGDPVIGLPSTGLHSNGYTLAREALRGLPLERDPEGLLGRPLGEALLEPTAIYVREVMELLGSSVDVRGLAHITSGGLGNLLRLEAPVGYEIDAPFDPPPLFGLIAERGGVEDGEMLEVFNMGCGFCCVVAVADEEQALEVLGRPHPGLPAGEPRVIGRATSQTNAVIVRRGSTHVSLPATS